MLSSIVWLPPSSSSLILPCHHAKCKAKSERLTEWAELTLSHAAPARHVADHFDNEKQLIVRRDTRSAALHDSSLRHGADSHEINSRTFRSSVWPLTDRVTRHRTRAMHAEQWRRNTGRGQCPQISKSIDFGPSLLPRIASSTSLLNTLLTNRLGLPLRKRRSRVDTPSEICVIDKYLQKMCLACLVGSRGGSSRQTRTAPNCGPAQCACPLEREMNPAQDQGLDRT